MSGSSPQSLRLHHKTPETTDQLKDNSDTVMVLIRAPAVALLMLLGIAVFAQHTSSAASRECCRSYSEGRLPFRIISGFSVQTVRQLCPFRAIIFHTHKGKACADPALDWVMDYITRLRNKAQMVHRQTSKS
ncbi:C-C motif chemokine 20a.3 [Lampris incognitus]|uniref:C-C motif chemokine 20a.3 n=1 Tax=Lampris incognitus TaxID=2546036 RepID=UPI0024B61CAC|nr:C-C motif chemokine 20a.3 [Lampris incognitus]